MLSDKKTGRRREYVLYTQRRSGWRQLYIFRMPENGILFSEAFLKMLSGGCTCIVPGDVRIKKT